MAAEVHMREQEPAVLVVQELPGSAGVHLRRSISQWKGFVERHLIPDEPNQFRANSWGGAGGERPKEGVHRGIKGSLFHEEERLG
jgi:hypothetical protein